MVWEVKVKSAAAAACWQRGGYVPLAGTQAAWRLKGCLHMMHEMN
jgi:hypothetical protein